MLQRTCTLLFALLFVASWLQPASYGQDSLTLSRITGPVTIDGRPDEAAWESVRHLPVVMYAPVYQGNMTEDTDIRIAYDESFLYMAATMYDSRPSDIRSNSLYRDRYSGDDTIGLILDTFNDNENALWFFTTPEGVRFDMEVTADAEFSGGDPFGSVINDSWNTFWDAEAVRFDGGWSAEMRIPFSSLGFQATDDRVEMGLITYRYIARKGERHTFPPIPPNWSMGFAKPSQAKTVILREVRSQRPVYVTPYAAGGLTRDPRLNPPGTGYSARNRLSGDIGGDIKYAVTNNLTLDATVNTDFAQVEADDQQVNLGRFSLFFPEKRQFFQERSGIFSFSTGRRDRLFHSRNIGLNDGEEVSILGGARVVGRVGGWDIGALSMQTAAESGLPSENFGVLRLRRRILNDQSYTGTMVTSRIGGDGTYNLAYGMDGLLRMAPDLYADVKWAQTFDNTVFDAGQFSFFDAALLSARIERRGTIGWTYDGGIQYSGDLYDPGIGFVTRTDFTRLSGDVQYGWLAGDESVFRTFDASLFGRVYFRNDDGTVESARLAHSWDFDYKSSASARVALTLWQEDLREPLSLPDDLEVPEGRYTFGRLEANYSLPNGALFRGRYSVRVGTFYDGRGAEIQLDPTWNLSRYLELSGSYRLTRLVFPDRDQSSWVHLVGIRSQMALNKRVSLNPFLQYNTAADLFVTNVRFRYNFREGNDLWIVYNENLNADRDRFDPVLPVSDTRTILLKYTYTFIP